MSTVSPILINNVPSKMRAWAIAHCSHLGAGAHHTRTLLFHTHFSPVSKIKMECLRQQDLFKGERDEIRRNENAGGVTITKSIIPYCWQIKMRLNEVYKIKTMLKCLCIFVHQNETWRNVMCVKKYQMLFLFLFSLGREVISSMPMRKCRCARRWMSSFTSQLSKTPPWLKPNFGPEFATSAQMSSGILD